MADKKVTQLTSIGSVTSDDLLLVINDPVGTPVSRKISIRDFFSNVTPTTLHSGRVTFNANTFVRGSLCLMTANVNVTGDLSVNGINVEGRLRSLSGGVANTMNTDSIIALGKTYLQVANATLYYTSTNTFNSYVANTNSRFENVFYANTLPANTMNEGTTIAFDGLEFSDFPTPVISFRVYKDVVPIGNNDSQSYVFFGGGGSGIKKNETLYLYKGFTYLFHNYYNYQLQVQIEENANAISNNTIQFDTFKIVNSWGGGLFANGVSGQGNDVIQFTVPQRQIANLYYESSLDANTRGVLVIK